MWTSRTARRLISLATAAVLVSGGCGVESGSGGAALPTPTTIEGGGPSTEDVTVEDLEAILPEAADIGAAYREVTDADDDDEPDPVQDAIDEQCPDMVAYQADEDDDEAGRLYEDTRGRQIDVSLKPSAEVKTDADLVGYVDAVNACDSVEVSSDGFDYDLAYQAEEVPDLGEQAIRLSLTVVIDSPDLPDPLTINTYGVNFRVQKIGVQVTGTDAVNGEQRVAFDESRLDPVVADLEARVEKLVEG